jgi:hypothetical protein
MQLLSTFAEAYLPSPPSSSRPRNRKSGRFFLVEKWPQLLGKCDVFDKAIAAVAAVYVGTANEDTQLIQHSIRLSNRAMQMFSVSIQRGSSSRDLALYGLGLSDP